MKTRSCLAFVQISLLLCSCGDPAPAACEPDSGEDCCIAEPSRPECSEPPTCEEDPTLPGCGFTCEEDPFQDQCRTSCEDDPLGALCVPSTGRPSAEVEVIRDTLGVPHIYAATDADVMWGSGYMQATDRLFQMDLARRRALGRRAEVFGRHVADDTLMRIVDIEGWAELGIARLRAERPALFQLIVAWTRGVNARIDEVLADPTQMPAGFTDLDFAPEHWRLVDGAAVGKLLLFGSSNQIENDILASTIREYLPEVWATVPFLTPLEPAYSVPEADRPGRTSESIVRPPVESNVHRPLPADTQDRFRRFRERFDGLTGEGSNNWAVDGRHTENGRPLIAGDPHQPLDTPAVFWLQHMHSDAGLDVIGFNFVGAPGVHLGHNADIVWTATLNYPDMMDIWAVRANESTVRVGDQDAPLIRTTETIVVRGAEPVEIVVERVPGYGVLLPDDLPPVPIAGAGRRMLFNWTGFTATDDFGGFYGINTADSVDAFEAAVDALEIGAFNFIAADADAISYISSMWVPERTGTSLERLPYLILDGDDPDAYWTGSFVPRELLPRSRAPERGWIATANNDPFGHTEDGDPTNDAYYFGVYYDPGTRSARIHGELTRLAERGAMTVDDMRTLQTDTHSVLADHLVPLLEDAWVRLPTDEALAEYRDRPELQTLYDLISGWDRRMERDAAAPVAFTALINFFARLAVEDEFSLIFEPILGASTVYMLKIPLLAAEEAWPGSLDMFQQGVPATVLSALSATASWLEVRFGGVDPSGFTWADLHCTSFGRIADVETWDSPCVPTDGGDGTVNVSSANLLDGGALRDEHRAGGGAVYRMVSSFGEDGVPDAQITYPRGNVEDASSPYFTNLLEDWVEGRYRPLPFRRSDVEGAEAGRTTLSP